MVTDLQMVLACFSVVTVGCIGVAIWVIVRLLRLLADAQDRNMTLSGTLAAYQMSKAPEPAYPQELTINHPITQAPIRVVHQGGGTYGTPDSLPVQPSTVSDVEGAPPVEWEER